MDSFTYEDAPLPQNIPWLPAPFPPWLTDETFPTFSETLLGTPFIRAAEHRALPSPPAAHGAFTPTRPDDGAIDCNLPYEGVTGVGLWDIGDQHWSTVVHTILPVSSTQRASSKNYSYGNNAAGPTLTPCSKLPIRLDQGATEGLRSRTQTKRFQTIGTCFFQHERSSGYEPQSCTPQGIYGPRWSGRPDAARCRRSNLVSVAGGFFVMDFPQTWRG